MKQMLIYGYGNPGRQDDGLGPLLAGKMETWIRENGIENVFADSNYQLNIEDASRINEYQTVIFVDATLEEVDAFRLNPVSPSMETNFTMHAVSPSFICGISNELFGTSPKAYLMQIKGYEWGFMKTISRKACRNLEKAFDFLCHYCKNDFNESTTN